MDLVDRLRQQAGCLDSELCGSDIDLLNEAAREIEQLKGAYLSLLSDWHKLQLAVDECAEAGRW